MHGLQGAFGEGLYIYLNALRECLKFGLPPSIFSLGLGLAYNEIISIAYFQKYQLDNFKIVSYEKCPSLISGLQEWLGIVKQATAPTWSSTYDSILERTAHHFRLTKGALKQNLQDSISSQKWILQGAFTPDTQFSQKFNCIFYDAFSEKTDPQLWDAKTLQTWSLRACQPNCVFSTYAAKGILKRILKEQGFTLIKRPGFAGKRHSTLAIRSG